MTDDAIVRVRGLTTVLNGKTIFDALDLDIPRGKVTAIMGPSRAAEWDSGVVRGCGRVPAGRPAHRRSALLAVWREREDVVLDLRRVDVYRVRWGGTDVRVARCGVADRTMTD